MAPRSVVRMVVVFMTVFTATARAGASEPASQALYHVTRTITLGQPDRWDYLTFDARGHRVYVAHGDRLTVVDSRTGRQVGSVRGMPGGTHGIVIDHRTGTGFTDDGKAGEAVAFDLRTLKVTHRIRTAADADGIVFDPATRHVFVIDGDPGKLSVIDPGSDKVIATIDVGSKLEFGAADGRGNLYVNGEARREIVHIDTRTDRVVDHWPMPGCDSPHGLAIDRRARRLFATCENRKMFVVNADNGAIVARLPIGAFSDGAAFDPVRKRAFSSNGDGSITVVAERGPDSFDVLGRVKTLSGGRTMTIDPGTGRLYVVAAHIVVNRSAAPTDYRHRYQVAPGSTKLLFLDPVK